MKMFKMLLATALIGFATVASANTLTIDFGGIYGGALDGTFGDSADGVNEVTGTDINISTITIQDDNGTVVYDITDGLLNFDTAIGGIEMTITGDVAGLTTGNATLFEGSFTDWEYSQFFTNEIFSGTGSGAIGADVLDDTVSIEDNPFVFVGFSLESSNGDVLSTDFLMTATGERDVPQVPVPAAVWLFGSGLIGLVGVARRKA